MNIYIFDTNVFTALGHYYPSRFPTVWEKIEQLVIDGRLRSVKEVRKEIENNCPFQEIEDWVHRHRDIFLAPSEEEIKIVTEIFLKPQNRGLVKRQNMLKGLPVADPFIIAAAKNQKDGCVVTQEVLKPNGARIPTVCEELQVACIDLEKFLENENLKF